MPDERSPVLRDEDIEAEARALLRETIQRSGWYPELPDEERRKRIEQDVDGHWHLMKQQAVERLQMRQRREPNVQTQSDRAEADKGRAGPSS